MPGALRLFQVAGITVSLHWSWFLVALWHTSHTRQYENNGWAMLQYLALFCIVLLHEFGHSLACRQVGGRAERIVLWPLGGIAFVSPPRRAGAVLWSIAAGPLVNVALVPVLFALHAGAALLGFQGTDLYTFISTLQTTNLVLLVFNLLPVYPLDGGQILQAVLWFFLGELRSLYVATLIGLVGAVSVLGFALYTQSIWLGVMAFFVLSTCWNSFQRARQLSRPTEPRHRQYACPVCKTSPKPDPVWRCPSCSSPVDVFASGLQCQNCNEPFVSVTCPECRQLSPASQWQRP